MALSDDKRKKSKKAYRYTRERPERDQRERETRERENKKREVKTPLFVSDIC